MPRRADFLLGLWDVEHPVYRRVQESSVNGWTIGRSVDDGTDLVLAPTFPRYDGGRPWVVLIEDWTTLYHPDLRNGKTFDVDVLNHARTAQLRALFSRPNFRGIVCHHRGTFADLMHLNLTTRLFYLPLGMPEQIPVPVGTREHLTCTFINSWKAEYNNFVNRGGPVALAAFRHIWEAGRKDVRLLLVSGVPEQAEYRDFMANCPGVEWINRHISDEDMAGIMQRTDLLLLPSARVHAHSILMPMSYGIPVLASDGWGNDEYIVPGVNGHCLPGTWGVVSFRRDGLMRENYAEAQRVLPSASNWVQTITALSDDRLRLARMGANAQRYVREVHTVTRMAEILRYIFDQSGT